MKLFNSTKKAKEIDRNSPVPYNTWGNTLRYKEKYPEAIAKYQQAIKNDPTFALAYSNWGYVFYLQKNYRQAIERYQKANAIDPRVTNHKWWGWALLDDQKYDEAIIQFQQAVDIDPNAVNGYNGLGKALLAQGKQTAAEEKFAKAASITNDEQCDASKSVPNGKPGTAERSPILH